MPGNGAAAGASYGDLLVTSLLVLGAVCIAAFVAIRVFGRLLATGRTRGAHLLDVVARVPLEPRRSLYVVEVAGKTLLVGTSEMGLSVLSELDASEVKSRVAVQKSFGELVREAWQRRKQRGLGATANATSAATAGATANANARRDIESGREAAVTAGEVGSHGEAAVTAGEVGSHGEAAVTAGEVGSRGEAAIASDPARSRDGREAPKPPDTSES